MYHIPKRRRKETDEILFKNVFQISVWNSNLERIILLQNNVVAGLKGKKKSKTK